MSFRHPGRLATRDAAKALVAWAATLLLATAIVVFAAFRQAWAMWS